MEEAIRNYKTLPGRTKLTASTDRQGLVKSNHEVSGKASDLES